MADDSLDLFLATFRDVLWRGLWVYLNDLVFVSNYCSASFLLLKLQIMPRLVSNSLVLFAALMQPVARLALIAVKVKGVLLLIA